MSKQVNIETRTVGQSFGTEATVKFMNNRRIHTTETFPYGNSVAAYSAARRWATEHGFDVVEDVDSRDQ